MGYTFMVSGLLLTDILGVRSLLLCGQGIVACFNFFQPKPLWFPVGWNLVFMCINSFQIARILNERRAIELNEEENALYLMGFSQAGMQPMLFRTLLAAGEWADVKAGERLTTIGEPNEHIYLFAKGRASVNVRGRSVATCRRGDFIGEMAFLNAEDRQAASATVVATMPSRVFRWNHTKLRELFQDSREIGEQTTRVLTDDLVQKMSKTHDLAAVHHYVQLMSVALAGDSVSVHTKDALREYMAQLSPDLDPEADGLRHALAHLDRIGRLASEDPELLRAMFVAAFEAVKSTSPLRPRSLGQLDVGMQKVKAGLEKGIADGSVQAGIDIGRAVNDISSSVYGIAYLWLVLADGFDLVHELKSLRERLIRDYGSTD